MSSRALRRARREMEEKQQLEQHQNEREELAENESDEQTSATRPASGFSIFTLLAGGASDDEEGAAQDSDLESDPQPESSSSKPSLKAASKKKKKKAKETNVVKPQQQDDDIDQILEQLSIPPHETRAKTVESSALDPGRRQAEIILSVDSHHLHVVNEMRRLFGRAAIEDEHREEPELARGARGGPRDRRLAVLAGRNNATSRLTSIGLKRNIFMPGKESWPPGSTGGLGMEIERKDEDGTVWFRFVHATPYQDVQRQFNACVESMDPMRLATLQQMNPYHVSTLLQQSEILTHHQGDYTQAGELLEMALFTFGRAVHSTFPKLLSQGKARVDFKYPENREFWLAGWRYIDNLRMRATWRTVFEWSKLLLAINPDEDPYCMRLVIDQYAMRARQPQWLIDFMTCPSWSRFQTPTGQYTTALAYAQTNKSKEARHLLHEAITDAPWIAAKLFHELGLDPVPPAIWGKQPPGTVNNVFTELYAVRAKDIWNTPEATSLLMEVAHSATDVKNSESADEIPKELSLSARRHVFMTQKREFIALLPSAISWSFGSSSDPMPPLVSVSSYDATPDTGRGIRALHPEGVDHAVPLERFTAETAELEESMGSFLDENGLVLGPIRGDRDDVVEPIGPEVLFRHLEEYHIRRVAQRNARMNEPVTQTESLAHAGVFTVDMTESQAVYMINFDSDSGEDIPELEAIESGNEDPTMDGEHEEEATYDGE